MAKLITVEWLGAPDVASLQAARGAFARVLVCDLRDPALAPLASRMPNADDLADASYPGASERSYFLRRRAVLRSFAALCAGVDAGALRVSYDQHGAPRVSGADVFVSVSNRGAHAALAVASSPVGVDLEPFDEAAPIIEDVLCKAERTALSKRAGPDRALAFLRIWTAKEAYLKALGRGFKRDPALVCVKADIQSFSVEDTGFAADLTTGAFAPRAGGGDLIVACAVLPG